MSDRTLPQDPAADDADDDEAQDEQARQQAGQGGGGPGAPAAVALSRRERLAAAAEKRRQERQKERAQAAAVGLDASEKVDDALVRVTDKISRFIKRHFNLLQWVIVGVIAVWIGVQIYSYRKLKGEAKVGDSLGKAAQAALASTKVEEEAPAVPGIPPDPTPKFSSEEERLKAARESFEAAIALKKSEGTVLLAELGLAGIELDQGKPAEARQRYERIRTAPLVQKDAELRGRALEGIALTHEAADDVEAAIKAYRELENSDIAGFVEMALLSQARLQLEKGEMAAAKEALDKLQKRLDKAEIKADKTFYLGPSLQALKTLIEPEAPTPPEAGDMGDLQKTLEELSKKMGSLGGAGSAEAPAGDAPTDPASIGEVVPTAEAPAAQVPAPAPEQAPAPGTPPAQDPSGGTQ